MEKALLPFLLLIFLVAGCGNSSNGKSEKIIIGMDESPLGYCNEQGEFFGFEVDLARATAERMGVSIEFKMIDWNKKEEELYSGNIDLIWNGLDITPERKEIMLFSKPYMDNRQVIVVLKGNPQNIMYKSDLYGKNVGAKAGSTAAIYINANENVKNSFAEFKTYGINEDTFKALEDGEIDAIIVDEVVVRYEMNKRRNHFEVVEITIGPVTKIGIGFRKDDTELCNRVQKAFDAIVKDGTAKKISEKWFQADLLKP